ncbi:FtsX-like permease family protein [Boudabousia marimammalium]|uniref:ABC3 transporter permease C-terminal domain-containing protein n=1 Tax=Boudabousia marimammalium TaxID=156892 RepID=A0A1Q5PSJ1_9ACTO|nr:FtsX-like permease family protein [Boudabousia marimammalium]OKL50503.1 hypothetical protein BM477_00575 [Boudabousia marimammalium]
MQALASSQQPELADAPISAIRVKAAGIQAMTPHSRETIRRLAEEIHHRTGLQVDIITDSALLHQTVTLPASAWGIPALELTELWSKKGVVTQIAQATDYKTLFLSIIILICSLATTVLTAHANLLARKTELEILAHLGWRKTRIYRLTSIEAIILGTIAGLAATALTPALTKLAGLEIGGPESGWLILPLILPLTIILTLTTNLIATLSYYRQNKPAKAKARPMRLRLTPFSLGFALFSKHPTRSLVSLTTFTIGTSSLSLLIWMNNTFQGQLAGNLLGNQISLQIRSSDLIAAGFLIALALLAISTVNWISSLEDQPVYRSITAIGWRPRQVFFTRIAQPLLTSLTASLITLALTTIIARSLSHLTTTLSVCAVSMIVSILISAIQAHTWQRQTAPDRKTANE